MMKLLRMQHGALILCAMLAGCGSQDASPAGNMDEKLPASQSSEPVEAAEDYGSWTGTWTGPEGLFAEITETGQGTYSVEMQSDLDTRGTYEGQATEQGIEFERVGVTYLLRPATGDETGLKYLAGKQDCLMVAEGEGYCRD